MRGKNRKTRRVKDKPARDAFRRRIAGPKPVPDEAAARFYATEAAAPVEDK